MDSCVGREAAGPSGTRGIDCGLGKQDSDRGCTGPHQGPPCEAGARPVATLPLCFACGRTDQLSSWSPVSASSVIAEHLN